MKNLSKLKKVGVLPLYNSNLSEQELLLRKWNLFFVKIKLFNFLVVKERVENIFSCGYHENFSWNLFRVNFLQDKKKLRKELVYSLYKKHFPTLKRGLFYEYLINRYFLIDEKRKEYARAHEGDDKYFFEKFEGTQFEKKLNPALLKLVKECWSLLNDLYEESLYLPPKKLRGLNKRIKEYVFQKTIYGSYFNDIFNIFFNDTICYDYDRKKDKKATYLTVYLLFYKYLFFLFSRKLKRSSFKYMYKEIPYTDLSEFNKFSWNGRRGHLYVRCTYSNVFFTVADVKGNVFYSITPSQISDKKNKKYKLSVHLTEKIVKIKLLPICKKYGLKRLTMILLGRAAKHAKSVEYFCKKSKIYFNDWFFDSKIPHHKGVKKKKKRRL